MVVVYFFSGPHYIKYTRGETGAGTLDTPTPLPISDWKFPKLPNSDTVFGANGVDAALYSGRKTYFFSGKFYVRLTIDTPGSLGSVDPGYPRPISDWGWHQNFGANGIDAALWSGPVNYFFSGKDYIRVTRGQSDFGNGGDPGYPKTIANGWGWPAPFSNKVKGALPSGQKIYAFSGNEYIRVSRGIELAGFIDPGYPGKNAAGSWGFPKGFAANGVDAALYSGGDLEPEPSGGLQSNVNYWLGSGGSNLTGLSVTVHIDNDLISTTDGFSLQLNAISEYVPNAHQAVVQQLVIYNPANTTSLVARLFFYGDPPVNNHFGVVLDASTTLGTLPANSHVAAGSSFTFTPIFNTDDNDKLTGSKFTYTPAKGAASTVTVDVNSVNWASTGQKAGPANEAPINALTLDIVADYSTSTHTGDAFFTEGQGSITYSATQPLTASTGIPSFSNITSITSEQANTIYAGLPANRPIDVSQLWGTTPPVPVDLEDVSKPKLVSQVLRLAAPSS